jgi:hypothetical protein
MDKVTYSIILCGLVGFGVLSYVSYTGYLHNDNFNYLKEGYDMYNYTCDSFEYGCCKIYDVCNVVDGELHAKSLSINPEYYVCKDEKCRNCPRLYTIISRYNDYMEETYYENSQIKCKNGKSTGQQLELLNDGDLCDKINYACDTRYYYDYVKEYDPHVYLYELQSTGFHKNEVTLNVYPKFNGESTSISYIWMTLNKGILNEDKLFKLYVDITINLMVCLIMSCFSICICNSKDFHSQEYEKTSNNDIVNP